MLRYLINSLCFLLFVNCSSQHCILEGKKSFKNENYDKALQVLKECSKKNHNDSRPFYWIGKTYLKLGNKGEAIKQFNKSLKKKNADSIKVIAERALAYYQLDKFKEGKEDLKYILNKDSLHFKANYTLGAIKTKEKKFEKAIQCYNRIKDKSPDSFNVYSAIGFTHYHAGKYKKAVEAYNKAIKLESNKSSYFYIRGRAFLELDKKTKALKSFSEAIKLDPKNKNAFISRGIVYFQKGEKKKACEDWEKAERLNSEKAKELYQNYCQN